MQLRGFLKSGNRPAVLSALLLLAAAVPGVGAQTAPDLSGVWKLDSARSVPPRKGEVTLRISEHPPELVVETTMLRDTAPPRHAIQRYTTDAKESVSTGADGDEFHTSITIEQNSLVFTIEEHEDGRILHSTETWSLIDGGATLKRVRESAKGGEQTLIYTRSQP